MMKQIRNTILGMHRWPSGCLVLLLVAGACKKSILVDPPVHEITTAAVFRDGQTAASAIAGLYSQMMVLDLSLANGAMSVYGGLAADELWLPGVSASLGPFATNSLSATDNIVRGRFWQKGYELIYHANACLEGMAGSTGVAAPIQHQYLGEARLVRAFCYFYLTQLFGDVPLALTTDYRLNAVLPRAPQEKVYEQIIQDLQEAERLLQAAPAPDRSRPNRDVATALLARVHLYRGAWAAAVASATSVLEKEHYQLAGHPDQVFVANSSEVLWQLYPVLPGMNSAEGYAFIPAAPATRPTYAITSSLYAAFAPGDKRQEAWLGSTTVGGEVYFYPAKYKIKASADKLEYNVVLRLAELYLIRAEARLHLQQLDAATEDLTHIRERAGLGPVAVTDAATLLRAIEQERQVELFAEWGHRWLDLKRWGQADSVLGAAKPGWAPGKALFPIPFLELRYNPFLHQNPGY